MPCVQGYMDRAGQGREAKTGEMPPSVSSVTAAVREGGVWVSAVSVCLYFGDDTDPWKLFYSLMRLT